MKERRNILKSTILLFGCFLALNLQMAQAQDLPKGADVKPICPSTAESPKTNQ